MNRGRAIHRAIFLDRMLESTTTGVGAARALRIDHVVDEDSAMMRVPKTIAPSDPVDPEERRDESRGHGVWLWPHEMWKPDHRAATKTRVGNGAIDHA